MTILQSMRSVNRITTVITMIIAVLALAACTAAHASEPIKTAEEAWQRALRYTGFDGEQARFEKSVARAQRAVFVDTLTPFLYESNNGVDVWVCTFDSVFLDFSDRCTDKAISDQIVKTYHVYLRAEDGRLLKIMTESFGRSPDLCREPLPEAASKDFEEQGDEFRGLPDAATAVTLLDALKVATPVNPLAAKEILADYVLYSYLGSEPVPCWVLLTRGIPPVELSTGSSVLPLWRQARLWCVVNAANGRLAKMSYGPIPRKPLEE